MLLRYANTRAAVYQGEYYRLVSTAFFHTGPLHLLVNSVSLVIAGSQLEALLGRSKFLAYYLVAALGGSTLTFFVGPESSVGASGALFGVMGALLAIAWRRRVDVGPIFVVIAANLMFGAIVPRINNVAHLGGLVTGLVLGTSFDWAQRRVHCRPWHAGVPIAVALVLAGLVVGHSRASARSRELAMRARLIEQQIESVRLADEVVMRIPPQLFEPYQAIDNPSASFTVFIPRDPQRPRTIRVEFGDGTSAAATVPKGTGVGHRSFSHRFPDRLARYEQRVVIVDAPDVAAGEGWTDVCPPGRAVRKMPSTTADVEAALRTPMCAGLPR